MFVESTLAGTEQMPSLDRPLRVGLGLQIYLLGPMRVLLDGEPLPGANAARRMHKLLQLLAYLAIVGKRGVRTEKLAEDMWSEAPNRIRILSSYLSTLRHVLEPEHRRGQSRYLAQKGDRLYLKGGAAVWVDIWAFDELAHKARCLTVACDLAAAALCWQEAIALYDAEGLLPDSDFLPGVVDAKREHLRQLWLSGLRFLAHHHAEQQDAGAQERAAEYWQALHLGEPCDEDAYLWLVAYYRRTRQQGRLRSLERNWSQEAAEWEGSGWRKGSVA